MKHAFSLVELSIVLVILGLLTGGILVGQSLIKAAELRSISTELNRYQAAIHAFRDKYFAVPGDMTNAQNFWGDNTTLCPNAATADGTPGTCNGNGNGQVFWLGESQRVWQQLALAGLIEGTYLGSGSPSTPGVMPKSRFGNMHYNFYSAEPSAGVGDPSLERLRFVAGNLDPAPANLNVMSALVPQDAWNIDAKLDDGMADQGKMRGGTGTDATAGCYAGSDYTFATTSPACYFTFLAS